MQKLGISKPNWFDKAFSSWTTSTKADQVLTDITNNPKIIKVIKDAIEGWEAQKSGLSLTQTVRSALAGIINNNES